MATYIKTEKGTEKVPAWIAKHLFNPCALVYMDMHIRKSVPIGKAKAYEAKARYFYNEIKKATA